MDNNYILSFRYSLLVVFVLVAIGWVHLHQRVAVLEKETDLNSGILDGMCGCGPPGYYSSTGIKSKGMGYIASDPLIGGRPGTSRMQTDPSYKGTSSDGFFGANEFPIFYDIGDVRAARTTRGWSTGYLTDAEGNPVYGADGKPVMASDAKHYSSVKDRKFAYGGDKIQAQMDRADARMRKAGYTKVGNRWVKPEGMWEPAGEGYWEPVSEGMKSAEDLLWR